METTALITSNSTSDITKDPKLAIKEFLDVVRTHVNNGKTITTHLRQKNEELVYRMEKSLVLIEKKVAKINNVINDKSFAWPNCSLYSGSSVGGAIGTTIGAPFAVFDAGLFAAVLALAGGLLGNYLTKSGENIGDIVV